MDRCNKEVNGSLGRDQRIDVMSQVQDLATSACTFVRGQGQHNNAVLKSPTVSAIHGTFRFLKAVLVIFSLLNQLYDTIEHWTLVDPGRRASAAKVPDSGGKTLLCLCNVVYPPPASFLFCVCTSGFLVALVRGIP